MYLYTYIYILAPFVLCRIYDISNDKRETDRHTEEEDKLLLCMKSKSICMSYMSCVIFYYNATHI